MFALVDCNNFYASCERAFQPKLEGKPVVVLSNNDGCVVSRSEEAKAIGVPMGVPLFQIMDLVKKYDVRYFSSNYQLYGDMSARVMNILQSFCPDVEIYSIDEAFLQLKRYGQTERKALEFSKELRAAVRQYTGIPVSVGIATTKTLAKLANHLAKKQITDGIFSLGDGAAHEAALNELPVSKVWGVGRAHERRLCEADFATVWKLRTAPEAWVRKQMSVVGVRTQRELQGVPCLGLEPPVETRKHLVVSRSFQKDQTQVAALKEACANHATQLGEKLRRFHLKAGVISVFVTSNRFKEQSAGGAYSTSRTIELPISTSDTGRLVATATLLAEVLYQPGFAYKKAGIMASELTPERVLQNNLFEDAGRERHSERLMEAMDRINARMGKNTVYIAACKGMESGWAMQTAFRSASFTTVWDDIMKVRI